jgi:glycosyltransferase domain-containing protein
MSGAGDALTALLPTRDRPSYCARQLSFLRENGFPFRIIVLDGSDTALAGEVRAASAGLAEYRRFDPSFRMADKLAAAIGDVATPFVILVPDDDVILPHAIEAELAFLRENTSFAVAHGYFLDFASHGDAIELWRVTGFTPSITDDDPLRRHFELFRRYQSFYWGVFRTPVFASAVAAATAMQVVLFRELTAMSVSILQGKVARLPLIHALRDAAPSHAPLHDSDPMFWMLRDAQSFFSAYVGFRDHIAAFIRNRDIAVPHEVELVQLLDMIYAAWFGREVETGKINHTVRLLLGDDLPPLATPGAAHAWQEPSAADEVSPAAVGPRRYVWRQAVLNAEPREEITIDRTERARVERQLDAHR